MKPVALFATLLICIGGLVFSAGFTGGEGWFWAVGNGFGFVALAGLFYLSMDARNGAKFKIHEAFSYFVLGLIVAHCAWLLLGDFIVIEYLKAGAQVYMWSGVLSFFLLMLVVFSSRSNSRKKEYSSTTAFRFWHKWLAISVVLTSLYHVIGSGFYLRHSWQWFGLSAIAITVFLISKRRWFRDSHSWKLAFISLVFLVIFVAFRGFSG